MTFSIRWGSSRILMVEAAINTLRVVDEQSKQKSDKQKNSFFLSRDLFNKYCGVIIKNTDFVALL